LWARPASIAVKPAWLNQTGRTARAGPTPASIIRDAESRPRPRRLDALDWAAKAVQENGYEIAQAFVDAAKRGDWRASQALMDRIYGKPEETVNRVDANPAVAVLKSMSLDEKLELLGRLREGEPASNAPAPPTIEGVLPSG
jgi:hypothetical protein